MSYYPPFDVNAFLSAALAEDVGSGDHTSLACIPKEAIGSAKLLVKDDGILAGMEYAPMIFQLVDPSLKYTAYLKDGDSVKYGDIAFEVSGSSISITTAERLTLNLMQRMSGVATKTFHVSKLVAHTKTKLLDTRKTTPGMRFFEKKSVLIGGGINHRYGLYDMILIKDNHSDYAGGISNALLNVRSYLQKTGLDLKVEAEARDLDEVKIILKDGLAFRILLDNFNPSLIAEAVGLIHGRMETEASGGITEENIVPYAEAGVDYISMGALTHSVKSLDLSLKAVK
ncbi:MAG: carboxylating nicotinate-nucleotide diphosphorylase [Flavobacteriales bacterium]|nr:carboxylating nicotinate-nucleotide diphosphorylase [Flavobacteriales bacterium]